MRFILDAMAQAQSRRGILDQDVPQSPERAVSPTFTPNHLDIQKRLQPLLHVEQCLIQKLSPSGRAGESTQLAGAPKLREVSVNALSSWQSVLSKLGHHVLPECQTFGEANDAAAISQVISARRDDIHALWTDPVIRALLNKRKLRIEDLPGLYAPSLLCNTLTFTVRPGVAFWMISIALPMPTMYRLMMMSCVRG